MRDFLTLLAAGGCFFVLLQLWQGWVRFWLRRKAARGDRALRFRNPEEDRQIMESELNRHARARATRQLRRRT